MMKTLSVFILVLVLASPIMAWAPYGGGEKPAILFSGGYDFNRNAFMLVGTAIPISPNWYIIGRGGTSDAGGEGELAVGYLFRVGAGWFVGPLFSPGTDIVVDNEEDDGRPPVAYLTSAFGATLGGTWSEGDVFWGFHIYGKWLEDFDDQNQLRSGPLVGGGLHFGW